MTTTMPSIDVQDDLFEIYYAGEMIVMISRQKVCVC